MNAVSANGPAEPELSYYVGKTNVLADILGAESVAVTSNGIEVDGDFFPILDDVILMMPYDRLPESVRERVPRPQEFSNTRASPFESRVQRTFGAEWTAYPQVFPEHHAEFEAYFDLVDLASLSQSRVADLGCGMGRWAYFMAPQCREIVLVDYSEAIFAARSNLSDQKNALFILADVLDLPFRAGAFDLAYCIGVLHHLPVDALDACRRLAPLAPMHLVYLYYALDNRPFYFRSLLYAVTTVRRMLARLPPGPGRAVVTWFIALAVYAPAAALGRLLRPLGIDQYIPLADAHANDSIARIRQDAYDRFFTPIEQRCSRTEILALRDTFDEVEVSDDLPYWHFVCRQGKN
jgi:SAM-dependent methyltransferase